MSKHKPSQPVTETVITLTLPDGGFHRSGTLLLQRGDLAKLMLFEYITAADIAAVIEDAQAAIMTLEIDPPVIPESSDNDEETDVSTDAVAREEPDDEPTIDILTETRGTVAVKMSYLKITRGATDAAAYRAATRIAAILLDAELWDGQHPIEIAHAPSLYQQLAEHSRDALHGLSLSDIVTVSGMRT